MERLALSLSGPQFLALYAVVILAVAVLLGRMRRAHEARAVPTLTDMDPYLVATLRGGPEGAIHLAMTHALGRGWIGGSPWSTLTSAPSGTVTPVTPRTHPIEYAVMESVRTPRSYSDLKSDPSMRAAVDGYRLQLEQMGLFANAEQLAFRRTLLRGGVGFLWLLAGVRIVLTVMHGKHNVLFLAGLALVAYVAVKLAVGGTRTAMGESAFQELTKRVPAAIGSSKAADDWDPAHLLNVAVWGISTAALANKLGITQRPGNGVNDAGGSDSSSSTSSSSGDNSCGSGDSSCGGDGGCGGGD